MKIDISKSGAESLRVLADKLDSVCSEIIEDTNKITKLFEEQKDNIGIIGDELFECGNDIKKSIVSAEEPLGKLAMKMRNTASEIEDYVNLKLIQTNLECKTGTSAIRAPSNIKELNRPDINNSSSVYAECSRQLMKMLVMYNPPVRYEGERTSAEIVERLGGGDNTQGSCSSLAFAYVGNIAGYDVLDFRDGNSRIFFSRNSSIEQIASLPGIDSLIMRGKDDIMSANSLINTMQIGKEYYLATGQHASIVRKSDKGFEYLELQHPTKNGWYKLDNDVLIKRFGCSQEQSVVLPNFLIDVASLAKSQDFLDLLGYINTSEAKQHKGENGYVR